jgi:hypothetical protein
LKAYLYREDCAPVLKTALPILDAIWSKQDGRPSSLPVAHSGSAELPDDIKKSLALANGRLKALNLAPLSADGAWTSSTWINGVHFTTRRKHKRDSAVFFRSLIDQSLIPGHIEFIRTSTQGQDWLVLRKLKSLPQRRQDDPFWDYPEFGAELRPTETSDELEVVPISQPIYHSISQPWAKGVIVVKCLNRVSSFPTAVLPLNDNEGILRSTSTTRGAYFHSTASLLGYSVH